MIGSLALAALGVVVLVVVGLALGNAAELGLVAAVLLLLFAGVALWAHHRRRLAEIHEADSTHYRGFRRVNRMIHWPKYCIRCGMEVHNRTELRCHLSYYSPCARLRQADEEELEATEAPDKLRVLEVRQHHGAQEYDSFMDDPAEIKGKAGELEAEERA